MPAQEKLLRDYCEQKQFQVERAWSIAETASKPAQRKLFREMMEYVRVHDIKLVIVEKVDRLVRSFVDLVAIDNWLEEDGDRQVHFVKDAIVLHRAARSQEKLNWGLRVLLAKNYIDNLKEEVEKGIHEKLARGGLPGKPPVGYVAVGDIGRKELVPDEMGPLVTEMFELYLQSAQSIASVARGMKRRGLRTKAGRPVVASQVHELLKNPIYIGKIPWAGKVYEGRHQQLVHPQTFQAVQDKFSGRRGPSPLYQKHDPLFRSIITCDDCKSVVTWERQKGRYYGRCKGHRPCSRRQYLREDRFEETLISRLNNLISPSPEIIESAIEEANADGEQQRAATAAHRAQLERRRKDLERRMIIAYEDRLDGRLSGELYDEIQARSSQEQEKIANELARTTDEDYKLLAGAAEMIHLCLNAGQIYRSADKEAKRKLIAQIFSNLRLKGEEVAWEWTKTVAAVARTVDEDRKLHETFEPDNFGFTNTKEALARTSHTLWLKLTLELRTLIASRSPTHEADVRRLLALSTHRTQDD